MAKPEPDYRPSVNKAKALLGRAVTLLLDAKDAADRAGATPAMQRIEALRQTVQDAFDGVWLVETRGKMKTRPHMEHIALDPVVLRKCVNCPKMFNPHHWEQDCCDIHCEDSYYSVSGGTTL